MQAHRPNIQLSIVLPTYNEGKNIQKVLNRIDQSLEKRLRYEVLIVDDNSLDGTYELAETVAECNHNVKVIRRPAKMGLSSALITGLEASNGDFFAVIDADLQHPPEILVDMFNKAVNGVDIVIASRYTDGGKIVGWDSYRRVASRVAIFLAKILPKTRRIKDPLSGCFIFSRAVVDGIKLEGAGWKLLLEILVKGQYKHIVEFPYVFRSRLEGRSKLGLRDYLDFIGHLLKLGCVRTHQ